MYSLEQRMKAVQLYIQYDFSATHVIRELGYPNYKMIKLWYEEYLRNGGILHEKRVRTAKYSDEQIRVAVDYYFAHGRNILKTTKRLGYPSHTELAIWIDKSRRDEKRHCKVDKSIIKYILEQKKQHHLSTI